MTDRERLEQLKNGTVYETDDINFLLEKATLYFLSLEAYFKVKEENKRYREALSFVESELYEVLHENKELNVKMFHIENAKRMITKVLNGEDEE